MLPPPPSPAASPPPRSRDGVGSDRIPPLPAESAPSDGWDQLDDYQLGKDVSGLDAARSQAQSAVQLPEMEAPVETARTTRTTRTTAFARHHASAEQDAEVMTRIMARQNEHLEQADQSIARARAATEQDERVRLRERQRREIADYLAQQRRRSETEQQLNGSLQQMMQDAADIFLALGVCPDHLEYLPDLGQFCSWGGRLYDHSELFAMRDARGQPAYILGPSPHGGSAACYSQREQRWRLHQPVASTEHLTPVERLLPVPRRREDGSLRYSAQRARTILMEEGSFMVFVVRNQIYSASHLRAAHFRDAVERRGMDPLLAAAADACAPKEPVAATGAAAVVDAATRTVTRMISSTTRLWRRDRS